MSTVSTIAEAAAALRDGSVTSLALTERALACAEQHDGAVGSYVRMFSETALAVAAAADSELAAGRDHGPLHGIPLGVKDIISTEESPTTAQSVVHDSSWHPADAVVVQRLRAAGAVITGKLTTMEFAIGGPDASKPFPIPRNPWNLDHWAGGSSSGSGSAVAAGMVLGALGTDTAGSIRIPSAFCGITGLMPTFGRVPKSGCVPLGYTLDHIGPMTRSAEDCALMLNAMAGYDRSDPTCLDVPVDDYLAGLTGDLDGVTVGVASLVGASGPLADPSVDAVFAAAVDALTSRGARVVEIELPLYEEMRAANMVIMLSEALAYHQGDLASRWSDYFATTRALISGALSFTGADYVQAQRVRRVAQQRMADVFAQVDLVATPTCAAGATSLEASDLAEPDAMRTIHTQYWDCIGNPAVSVPMGFTPDGLPLGLQIAARPLAEALALRAADAYQHATDWHRRVPPMVAEPDLSAA
ncbi:amidase [Gordonia sp. SL306]|uniref:amidase n=1 Tax=Gordonia sp. SL306 TaxID=2995145 RepID=UPI00226F7E61|nr:amidase [Gordonia sp. SL306]WAC57249.1 amidase [Gordonia sp. SL306]